MKGLWLLAGILALLLPLSSCSKDRPRIIRITAPAVLDSLPPATPDSIDCLEDDHGRGRGRGRGKR